MNADFLWTAIFPLGLLAIYALTALTNRDPKPLPGRAPSNSPYGPRPQPPPPLNRPPTPERTPEIRWAPMTPPTSPPPRPGGLDDDIVIIEPARTVRPTGSRGVSPNRRNRPKQGGTAASKPSVSGQSKGLANVSQVVNQQIASAMVIKPLTETTVAQPVQRSASASASQPLDMEGSGQKAGQIAAAFTDRSKLREAFILSEVLQLPVSLRKKRRHP